MDADKACASQSGRILKASWGIFWIIVGSAYSAYMTTNFAVRSKELTLTSLQDILQRPELQLGINKRMTALVTLLESSADDPVLSRAWRKLLEHNSTDSMTFSDNVTYHVAKVLEGNYAFMTALPESGVSLRALMQEYPALRVKEQQDYPSINLDYIGLPTNCFYRDELYRSLLDLQKLHLTSQFQDYQPARTDVTKINDQTPIGFSRIVLLLCVVAGGAGLAGVVLMGEVGLVWIQRLGHGRGGLGRRDIRGKSKWASR